MKTILCTAHLLLALLSALFIAPVYAQDNPCEHADNRLANTACLEYQVEQAALKTIDAHVDRDEEERRQWKAVLRKNQIEIKQSTTQT